MFWSAQPIDHGPPGVAADLVLPRAGYHRRAGRDRAGHGPVELQRRGVRADPLSFASSPGRPCSPPSACRAGPGRADAGAGMEGTGVAAAGGRRRHPRAGLQPAGRRGQRQPELDRGGRPDRPAGRGRQAGAGGLGRVRAGTQAGAAAPGPARARAGGAGGARPARARPGRPRPRHRAGADGPDRGPALRRGRADARLRRQWGVRRGRRRHAGRGQPEPDAADHRLAGRRRTARTTTGCAGRRCTPSGRWPRAAGGGSDWARAGRSGPGCRRRTTTSSSPSSARSSAWSGRWPCWGCSRCSPWACCGWCSAATTCSSRSRLAACSPG